MTDNEIAINKRIEELRLTTGLNATDFARSIGVRPNTYLVSITYSRRKPSIELMQAVMRRYMISGRWLLLGDGAMWDKSKVSQNEDMQSLIATAKSIMQQVSRLEGG